MKDFSGYRVFSTSSCAEQLNGKVIDKTIKKAFPNDPLSSLYVVKIHGKKGKWELYENEMYE